MNQEHIEILDTRIVSITKFDATARSGYAIVSIAYKNADFAPGQFLMVKTNDGDVRWGYSYTILSADDEMIQVIAPKNSDLFQQVTDAEVVVWGPRGTGPLKNGEPFILAAEPVTFVSVMPFSFNLPEHCRMLLLVGNKKGMGNQMTNSKISTVSINNVESLCMALESTVDEKIIVALNPSGMQEYRGIATEKVQERTLIYVPTRIGCGIGACTGCVISSSEIVAGLKICEVGPFIPLRQLNIEADIHSFVTRI